ncbi:MAG: GrpB family protein [Leptolyngbyaceae cyanobacterium]
MPPCGNTIHQYGQGDNVVAIHHSGSTAIPHICAKVINDLLAEVQDIAWADLQTTEIAPLAVRSHHRSSFGNGGISSAFLHVRSRSKHLS